MLTEVKKCVDNYDIKGLRYIFTDCLDVDPTFEKYKEDYEYCKGIKGFFEEYQELTILATDNSTWTMQYWEQLRIDLTKNFSQNRFEHMVKVAKVVYADKISRLFSERSVMRQTLEQRKEEVDLQVSLQQKSVDSSKTKVKKISQAELQRQRVEEKMKKIEDENRQIEEIQRTQRERIKSTQGVETERDNITNRDKNSKKVLGIVLAIVVVVLIVIALH